jgi:Flp pilus assembly pilin Flp
MLNLLSCLIRDEHGATAIEYAMLIVFVALAIAQALAGGAAAY